jgi:hypothetical protein
LTVFKVLGGGGVGVAPVGSARGASGGGVGMVLGEGGASGASPGLELVGAEVSGAALEGEDALVCFFFIFGTGGTRGSARPAASSSAPMLLAPVSCLSGRKERSSSVRGFGDVGAARPELVVPPEGEAEMLPAPDDAGLERGGGVEVLGEPSEPAGPEPSLSAGLRKRKKNSWRKATGKRTWQKEASKKTRNLPGGSRHLLAPVATHAHFLLPQGLSPEALGGRGLTGTSIRCRHLVLLALGHEFVHKLGAGLGAQGRHVLVDL